MSLSPRGGRRAALRAYDVVMRLSVRLLGVVCASFLFSCGGDDRATDGGGDPMPRCEAYCEALRTEGGCGSDVESCKTDCELWIEDNDDAGCSLEFDGLMSCTSGAGANVCSAVGGECSSAYGDWMGCIEKCDVPGEVVFSPACPSSAPCKSGTSLTIASDVALACGVRVVLDCAGGSATGYIPAGDPATATGTLELSCTQASSCGLRVDAANRYLSGGTDVYCTP